MEIQRERLQDETLDLPSVPTERAEIKGNRVNWPKLQVGNRVAVRCFLPWEENEDGNRSLVSSPADSLEDRLLQLQPLLNSWLDDSPIGQYDTKSISRIGPCSPHFNAGKVIIE